MGVERRCSRVRTVSPRHLLKTKVNSRDGLPRKFKSGNEAKIKTARVDSGGRSGTSVHNETAARA